MNGSKRWAIFISGRGSNLQSLLSSARASEIALVLSSKASAEGLYRARRAGVATEVLPSKIDWQKLHLHLRDLGVTNIFLLGFMKVIPADFLQKWPSGQIVNIHPSLLPSYPGLRSIERAFKEGAELGATVHEVIPEVDGGKVLFQASAGRATGYPNLHEAAMAVHRLEHRLVRKCFEGWPS